MTENKRFDDIKVTRWVDGEDRVVTVNGKVLSKAEIVDLLVEYMEENNKLNGQIEHLKKEQYGVIANDSNVECPKCRAIPEYWLYEDGKVSCPNCDMKL